MTDSQSNRNFNFNAAVGSFWWLTRPLEKEKNRRALNTKIYPRKENSNNVKIYSIMFDD